MKDPREVCRCEVCKCRLFAWEADYCRQCLLEIAKVEREKKARSDA